VVTVLACAFFTSFTGASGITILALGGLLMPVLLAARYSERNALGLLTGSGSIGLLFPPCLPVILYAIIAKVEINKMFLGGILPGVLLVIAASLWGIRKSPKDEAEKTAFRWSEARSALWEAKWEMLLPVVAIVPLVSGYATAVETSAFTALYAFIVETFIYRDLKIKRDLTRVMTECGLLIGAILLILGAALGFTGYLIDAQVPDFLITWVKSTVHTQWAFLLALNFFLLIVGCLMDIFSAIVVVVPIMLPIGVAFGVDPVHLGIIFLANLELGYLTPPVGMNLYLSSYRFNKPMPEVVRSIIPILLIFLGVVLLITYVPFFSTALPRWFQ
jgi:C4-dicarboxylate transporter, DctM subunit